MTSNTSAAKRRFLLAMRAAVTLTAVAAGTWAVLRLWDHYELAPWTRDGRVRANVVQIAPDVSGLVNEVAVHDNQPVRAGDPLFSLDRARYELAVRQAATAVAAQRITLAQALREERRSTGLGELISAEVREQAATHVEQAHAAVAQAEVALASARLNLERASVRAPVAGVVTNLDLRAGGYASAGRPVLALVDTRSLYVEGYFEETKLPRIRVGDRVRVQPLGSVRAFDGTVESIAAGIADRDRSTSADLLPNVTPTFNWVRLAQRVPVRVRLDALPADVQLVSGETVTVEVVPGSGARAATGAGGVM